MAIRLFELFPDLEANWPTGHFRRDTGHTFGDVDVNVAANQLAELANVVTVEDVRQGAIPTGVSLEGRLRIHPTLSPNQTPPFQIVIESLPDVAFRPLETATHFPRLLVSQSIDGEINVVIEALPVEIRLPTGLVQTPWPAEGNTPAAEIGSGTFTEGILDSQRIIYRDTEPTSVFTYARVVIDQDRNVSIVTTIPIVFGPCRFSGLPCRGVYGFELIPSPTTALKRVEWLRHKVDRWFEGVGAQYDGLYAIRSITVDSEAKGTKHAMKWLQDHMALTETAEFVLDDLVLPAAGELFLPIPRHITAGIRRNVEDPHDLEQVAGFEKAPLKISFRESPPIGLIFERLFARTLPTHELAERSPVELDAALYWGEEKKEPRNAVGIEVADEYTVLLTYRRDIEDGSADAFLLDWKIFGMDLSLLGLRTGVSIARALDGEGFGDSFVLVGDLAVKGGEESTAGLRLEGVGGGPVDFLLERVGWWFGPSLEGVALPDGVQIVFFNTYRLIILELGLTADSNGGHYLVFSGGVDTPLPAGAHGKFIFRRLRIRLSGNPDAPRFGLDGFFIALKIGKVEIEVGGFFTERREGPDLISEIGLAGSLKLPLGAKTLQVSIDLLTGSVSGSRNFRYFLIQVYVGIQIPINVVTLLSIRALFGKDLRPKLSESDKQSRELRYYTWAKRTSPVQASPERRLDQWIPADKSYALGFGAGVTLTALSEVIHFELFLLYAKSPVEQGALISLEAYLLKSTTPVFYAVVEWDGTEDTWKVLAGVDLSIEQFFANAPSWLKTLIRITGTILVVTKKPTIVAIGRLKDPLTWLRTYFDIDLWLAKSFIEIAVCYEKSPGEVSGFALTIRAAGRGVLGPGLAEYYFGIGFFIASFDTGSVTFAMDVWGEAGFRYRLFGFLNVGLHAQIAVSVVGPDPDFALFEFNFRIETPWFLPDIKYHHECEIGGLEVSLLDTMTGALRSSGAISDANGRSVELFITPGDLLRTGDQSAPVVSLRDLQALPRPSRNVRVAEFEAANAEPIATDGTVQVVFTVPVDDITGLSADPPAYSGLQQNGNLGLQYELISVRVTRRQRFDPGAAWKELLHTEEIQGGSDGAGGFTLTGTFDPLPLTAFWDEVGIGDEHAALRLSLNATTPFTFLVSDPEQDEEILERNPDWPCCPKHRKPEYDEKVLIFNPFLLGNPLPTSVRFSDSTSMFRVARSADVRLSEYAGSQLVAGTQVARLNATPGMLFRVVLHEEAAWIDVRPSWALQHSPAILALISYDESGQVARETIPMNGSRFPINVRLRGDRPVTEMIARVEFPDLPGGRNVLDFTSNIGMRTALGLPLSGNISDLNPSVATNEDTDRATVAFDRSEAVAPVSIVLPRPKTPVIEFDRIAYTPWRSLVDVARRRKLCGSVDERGFAGDGKVSFLPNHDYEIEVRTRLTLDHATPGGESSEYSQYIYFRTKGLPGLNAVSRVGEEVEPYVESEYPRNGCVVYREEPIAIAFNEKFNVIVPITDRTPAVASAERDHLMELALVVRPDVADVESAIFTATQSEDWIVAHRTFPWDVVWPGVWEAQRTGAVFVPRLSLTSDAARKRLSALVLRPGATCVLPDPEQAPSGVLMHPPMGHATTEGGAPLWPPRTSFEATAVIKDAPFIHRERFAPADLTAFEYRGDGAESGASAWSVGDTGVLEHTGDDHHFALFGEASWDHIQITTAVDVSEGSAGVGCFVSTVSGASPPGLVARIERQVSGLFLSIRRRVTPGAALSQVASEALSSETGTNGPIALIVTTFDDRLRAVVGETIVEVEREGFRSGRLALTAQGTASFPSLAVGSLPLYQMPFATSRYESFEEHIDSYPGRTERISAADLGTAPTESILSLYNQTFGDIAAVMHADADPSARNALFARWVDALAIPVRELIEGLEITRLEEDGEVRALILESPEPLKFSFEVKLSSVRFVRRRVRPTPPSYLPDLESVRIEGDWASFEIESELMLGIGDDLALVSVEAGANGEPELRVFRGRGKRRRRSPRAHFRTRATEVYLHDSSTMPDTLRALWSKPIGTVALLNPSLRDLLGSAWPIFETVEFHQEFVILSDGPETRTLLIPLSSGAPETLVAGRYRFDFQLDRQRWQSISAPLPEQRYIRSAQLEVTL